MIKVLRGKVLVEMQEKEKEVKTDSGLVIACIRIKDTDRYVTYGTGKVLALGEDRVAGDGSIVPYQVKIGDYVYWQRYAETRLKDNQAVVDEGAIFAMEGAD